MFGTGFSTPMGEGIIWFQPLLREKTDDLHPKNLFCHHLFGGGIKDAVWCPAAMILAACSFSSSGFLHHGGGAAYVERLVSTEAETKKFCE